MRNMFDLLAKKNILQKYSKEEMSLIIQENRKSLSKIDSWVDKDLMASSVYEYGIPDSILNILDTPVGDKITYTDLIAYLSKKLDTPKYLELGVSVGKNFYQLSEFFKNSQLTGFDIEDINSVLNNNFELKKESEFPSLESSMRKRPSYIREYQFKTNVVKYLAGDILDQNAWAKLSGHKFNLIFSDALHEPSALLWEYKMLEHFDLLENNFIMFWDDLSFGLEESFNEIALLMKKKYKILDKNIQIIKVNGWLGVNEYEHNVGIISSLNLN